MNNKVYLSFDDYVADHPDGESFRRWITNEGRRNVVLLPVQHPEYRNCLPGGYLWSAIICWPPIAAKPQTPNRRAVLAQPERWIVWVNDNDDGCCCKQFSTEANAKAEMLNLQQMVPFDMPELFLFGYASS
jgi:hypothetical protein